MHDAVDWRIFVHAAIAASKLTRHAHKHRDTAQGHMQLWKNTIAAGHHGTGSCG